MMSSPTRIQNSLSADFGNLDAVRKECEKAHKKQLPLMRIPDMWSKLKFTLPYITA
jgi:hypothetical protein